jgi:hypothetical protein
LIVISELPSNIAEPLTVPSNAIVTGLLSFSAALGIIEVINPLISPLISILLIVGLLVKSL